MSGYLARLKAQDAPIPATAKTEKRASFSSFSTHGGPISRINDLEETRREIPPSTIGLENPAPLRHWRFRVGYPDGTSFEVRTLPEATVAEARSLWPGAAIEPLPDLDESVVIQ